MSSKTIAQDDFPKLEGIIGTIVKDKQRFERLEMRKEDLLRMFAYNEFKQRILNEKVQTPTTTVYRCGPLIDLCRGPHVRDLGKIKGNVNAEQLQRVYGISFPDTKQLKQWRTLQEEAASGTIETRAALFGTPKGTHIYNTLLTFMQREYRQRGFQEVISPNIYNAKLWAQSGHWHHYAENMFRFEIEKEQFGLKPMNCPGHCLTFDYKPHAYNELPIRYADFGVLHRNEMSGALSGMTRVLLFGLPQLVYVDVFGFTFRLFLRTRPEDGYLGDLDTWNTAEAQPTQAQYESELKWELNPGDGAFYGPKIDIQIKDALGSYWQCATIQLDFQLPQRFDLTYFDEHKERHRPVMIHRAILGSIERMVAIRRKTVLENGPFGCLLVSQQPPKQHMYSPSTAVWGNSEFSLISGGGGGTAQTLAPSATVLNAMPLGNAMEQQQQRVQYHLCQLFPEATVLA
ncbi:hypothetical protein GPALN_006875 [Globodera pallida]|nr:hypothetical protein GPALN_006875 [Globodera pallida]